MSRRAWLCDQKAEDADARQPVAAKQGVAAIRAILSASNGESNNRLLDPENAIFGFTHWPLSIISSGASSVRSRRAIVWLERSMPRRLRNRRGPSVLADGRKRRPAGWARKFLRPS